MSTPHLFDLSKIDHRWSGYFTDADLKIYSTKRSATPQLLFGTHTASGRYFTLNGRAYAQTYLHDIIRNHSSLWRDWVKGMTTTVLAINKAGKAGKAPAKVVVADRTHAATTEQGVQAKGWVIGSIIKGRIVLGSNPKIHLTELSVKKELERLAMEFKGSTFVSMKIEHEVVAAGITWR